MSEGEPEIDPILEKNLQIVESQMTDLLNRESIGGNAGRVDLNGKTYSLTGANLFFNVNTGEIKIIANDQNTPSEIINDTRNKPGTYSVVFKPGHKDDFKAFSPIVSFSSKTDVNEKARERLIKTADRYNQKHAPELPVEVVLENK